MSGPENLKKSKPKKLLKSNKAISWNFPPKFNFLLFQKWPKINFWTGKKFKTAKNAISQKKIDLFDFTSFLAWTFLNFLAHYVPLYITLSSPNLFLTSSYWCAAICISHFSKKKQLLLMIMNHNIFFEIFIPVQNIFSFHISCFIGIWER